MFNKLVTLELGVMSVDLETLRVALPQIRSLHIRFCHPVRSWESLVRLTELEHLEIEFGLDDASKQQIEPALTVIRKMVPLTSVRLSRVPGIEACAALLPLTRIEILSLRVTVPGDEMPEFQRGLAALSPSMRNFDLSLENFPHVPTAGSVPAAWTRLERVVVPFRTEIPYLNGIVRLAIREVASDEWQREFSPLPRNLELLWCPYSMLLAAVACDSLKELIVTRPILNPSEPEPEPDMEGGSVWFPASQQEALQVAVSQAGIWPLLDRVLFLRGMYGTDTEEVLYRPQLLDALASRSSCIITHVTLQLVDPLISTLCKIQSLRSITLIDATVSLDSLRPLLKLPNLKLIEFVRVDGLVSGVQDLLQAEADVASVHLAFPDFVGNFDAGNPPWTLVM